MGKLYFPHLMITPKKLKEIGACSRGCTVCRDNVVYETPIDFSKKHQFYQDVQKFFTQNTLRGNVEVTFLNYGDFFSPSFQVQNGIEKLFEFSIIPQDSNIGVWTRANAHFSQAGIAYLQNWNRTGKITLKISLDISKNLQEISEQILYLYSQLLILSKIEFPHNVIFLVQLNNIEFMKIPKSQHIYLYSLIQKIVRKFSFVQVVCSDFEIQGNFSQDFFEEFFHFEIPHICTYLSGDVEYSLEKNFLADDELYISHVDILEDAITIHNPYCKRLTSNYFGTITDSVGTLNANIRAFTQTQIQFSEEFRESKNMICNDCNALFDAYMQKKHFV